MVTSQDGYILEAYEYHVLETWPETLVSMGQDPSALEWLITCIAIPLQAWWIYTIQYVLFVIFLHGHELYTNKDRCKVFDLFFPRKALDHIK